MKDFLLDLIIGSIKREILADLLNDRDILELDDDTFDFIWNIQYDLENNESIQELLEERKEQFMKEMVING